MAKRKRQPELPQPQPARGGQLHYPGRSPGAFAAVGRSVPAGPLRPGVILTARTATYDEAADRTTLTFTAEQY